MTVYELTSDMRKRALRETEIAMGHHEAGIKSGASLERGYVVCGRYFVSLAEAGYVERPGSGVPPPMINVATSEPSIRDLSEAPWLRGPDVSLTILPHASALAQLAPGRSPSPLDTPPFVTTATREDLFYRLSAFRHDHRIGADGAVAPQTYTTTDSDMGEVPSGLAAVGRYALPSRLPAVFVFAIAPPPGTQVAYGTVTPANGLAGGGVEAFFPKGCAAGSARFQRRLPMK